MIESGAVKEIVTGKCNGLSLVVLVSSDSNLRILCSC